MPHYPSSPQRRQSTASSALRSEWIGPLTVCLCIALLFLPTFATAEEAVASEATVEPQHLPPHHHCIHEELFSEGVGRIRHAPAFARAVVPIAAADNDDTVSDDEKDSRSDADDSRGTHRATESAPATATAESASASSSSVKDGPSQPVVWRPLRIEVFANDLTMDNKYCATAGQQVPDFLGGSVVCAADDVLTTRARASLLQKLLPETIAMHAARLEAPATEKIVLNVPFGVSSTSPCRNFAVPPSHFYDGVVDTDFVLYVSAVPITNPGTAAWATTCQVDPTTGRPVAGVLNVAPSLLIGGNVSVRTLAHETLHALGFSGDVFQEKGMITSVPVLREKLNVRGVSSPKTLQAAREQYGCAATPLMELDDSLVASKGPCEGSHWKMRNAKDDLMSNLNTGGAGLYTAITIAAMEDTGFYRGNYSNAEEMAWAKNATCPFIFIKCLVNGVPQTAPPVGGAHMFCWNSPTVKTTQTTTLPPTVPASSMDRAIARAVNRDSCTFDRLYMGTCDLFRSTTRYPSYAQYFDNPTIGGTVPSMDECPFIMPATTLSCGSGSLDGMTGSVVSPSARCFAARDETLGVAIGDVYSDIIFTGPPAGFYDPKKLSKKTPNDFGWVTITSRRLASQVAPNISDDFPGAAEEGYGDGQVFTARVPFRRLSVCADVKCDVTSRTYTVRVRGSRTFVSCTVGDAITPSESSGRVFLDGQLTCPPFDEVCPGNNNTAFGNATAELAYLKDSAEALTAMGSRAVMGAAVAIILALVMTVA